MKKLMRYAVMALCFAAASATQACGVCVEDKMAATYDHSLVTRALQRGHEVLFLEVVGAEPANQAQWRFLVRTVEGISGVGRGSVRTSVAPPALSFEFDASRASSATVLTRINDRLRKQQVKVELIRVVSRREMAAR